MSPLPQGTSATNLWRTARNRLPDTLAGPRRTLARWQRAVGGRAGLRRRLRWSGFSSVCDWLVAPVSGDPAVDWPAGLRELVHHLSAAPNAGPNLDALLQPAAEAAVARTLARTSAACPEIEPLLGDAARSELARGMVRRLAEPLLPAWNAWMGDHPLARLAGEDSARAALQVELATQALRPLLERFPVAARLAGTVFRLESAAQEELLLRIARDFPDLRERWPLRLEPGAPPVRALRLHLSDPHRGGRAVARVEFADGTRIACKPHALELEAALESWWCDADPERPRIRYLTRDHYGWMEWIEARPPADVSARLRLHRRIGVLLAHALEFGLSDLHRGNVLLAGEHPLVVDAECLRPDMTPGRVATAPRSEDPVERLLGTGVLPRWRRRPRVGGFEVRTLLGTRLSEAETNEVIAGFLGTAPTVHPPERLETMASARARFLTRPTASYSLLQHRLLRPDALEDIRRFDALVDTLVRGWTDAAERPVVWPLIEAERRALYRLDVPAFDYVPARTHLQACDDTRLEDAFPAAASSCWPARSPAASRAERERHREAHATLLRRVLRPAPPPPVHGGDPVESIVRHLLEGSIPAADGAPTWLGYDCDPAELVVRPALADNGVYQGRAGIALFLLAASDRSAGAGEVAAQVFEALAQTSSARPDWAHGCAGRVLALDAAGELAGRADWRASAAHRAGELERMITGFRGAPMDAWSRMDLFSGLAGVAVALAVNPAGADTALTLVRQLQQWLDRNPPARVGLMHGASGLAVAAGNVAAACMRTGRDRDAATAWRTAMAAVRWENRIVDPIAGRWAVEPGSNASWCRHTAGIAFARASLLGCGAAVGMMNPVDQRVLRDDLQRALAHVAAFTPGGPDLLCCGQLGPIAALLLTGGEMRAEAHRRLTAWTARVAASGWNLDATPPEGWLPPGLCRGLAGAGFVLLAAEDERARRLLARVIGFMPHFAVEQSAVPRASG